ncbi:MAG: hypothetical protein IAI48_15895 [Candidatus Eremiobacteraeota bacterium]|nr:hypothetical protein [Candidatus Eremiobacteraeota bacterium]
MYGRFHFPDLSTPVMVVYLVRDVPYTDWYLQSRVYDTSVRNQKRDLHVTQFDPAAKACLQITTADASGSFTFSFIAPGRYYILTNVEYRNAGSVTSQPVAFARPDGEVTAIVGGASSFTEHAMQMEYSRVFEVGAGDEFHMNDSADGWTRVECGRLRKIRVPAIRRRTRFTGSRARASDDE